MHLFNLYRKFLHDASYYRSILTYVNIIYVQMYTYTCMDTNKIIMYIKYVYFIPGIRLKYIPAHSDVALVSCAH